MFLCSCFCLSISPFLSSPSYLPSPVFSSSLSSPRIFLSPSFNSPNPFPFLSLSVPQLISFLLSSLLSPSLSVVYLTLPLPPLPHLASLLRPSGNQVQRLRHPRVRRQPSVREFVSGTQHSSQPRLVRNRYSLTYLLIHSQALVDSL